jgi:hypothetical protein
MKRKRIIGKNRKTREKRRDWKNRSEGREEYNI